MDENENRETGVAVPAVSQSGSDGKQTALEGEVLSKVTANTVPQDRFVEALQDVVSNSQRGLANQSSSHLTLGALEQKVIENRRLEETTERLRADLAAERKTSSSLSESNSVKDERIRTLRTIHWVSGLLYVVATILTGIATTETASSFSMPLYGIAGVCIIAGLFAPSMFGKSPND